jgi:hypothetical protein
MGLPDRDLLKHASAGMPALCRYVEAVSGLGVREIGRRLAAHAGCSIATATRNWSRWTGERSHVPMRRSIQQVVAWARQEGHLDGRLPLAARYLVEWIERERY